MLFLTCLSFQWRWLWLIILYSCNQKGGALEVGAVARCSLLVALLLLLQILARPLALVDCCPGFFRLPPSSAWLGGCERRMLACSAAPSRRVSESHLRFLQLSIVAGPKRKERSAAAVQEKRTTNEIRERQSVPRSLSIGCVTQVIAVRACVSGQTQR